MASLEPRPTSRVPAVPDARRVRVGLAREGVPCCGKGRGRPPAALDLGDLFAYALARHLDAPLLLKGNDFPQTDITPALPA